MPRKSKRRAGRKPVDMIDGIPADKIDHNRTSFVAVFETSSYVIHRVGPLQECEHIYGPFHDISLARSKLAEKVEAFLREHSKYEPRADVRASEYAKISIEGLYTGVKVAVLLYRIKPLNPRSENILA